MIRIRDPLHGSVQLTDLEEKLLDSPQMQRLRGIRQLAMAYLVYPGANHTRFEHSIGTLYLAGRICQELGLDEDKSSQVRAAALLHDIGHTPFSHEAEAVLSPFVGSHEKIGERQIRCGEIADILSESFSPNKVALLHRTSLGQMISSDIGADRMDYLLRDSHYTGVAYGVIDADRICSTLEMDPKGIYLSERGLPAAESLLVARFTMFSAVYLHKTVRIASRMLQEALSISIANGEIDPREAAKMSDAQLFSLLLDAKSGRELAARLSLRRLYKKAYSCPVPKISMPPREAEEQLSRKCGCSVLIDVPSISLKASVRVQDGKRKVPISAVSQLVASLEKMQQPRLEAIVMCDERHCKKVSLAARRMLG